MLYTMYSSCAVGGSKQLIKYKGSYSKWTAPVTSSDTFLICILFAMLQFSARCEQ